MPWGSKLLAVFATALTVPFLSSCVLQLWASPIIERRIEADQAATMKLIAFLNQIETFDDPITKQVEYGWDDDLDIPDLDIRVVRLADQELFLRELRKWKDTSRFDAVIVRFYGDPDDSEIQVERLKRIEWVDLRK